MEEALLLGVRDKFVLGGVWRRLFLLHQKGVAITRSDVVTYGAGGTQHELSAREEDALAALLTKVARHLPDSVSPELRATAEQVLDQAAEALRRKP